MASHHRRRDNEEAKTPHFFKIILDQTIRDRKLAIPRSFVRKYGNRLPNSVLLKVPSGAEWQVELTKGDEDVWLQKGWQDFVEYYSLDHGHFLVFRYEVNSHFSVVIFDSSASEIEYPYTITLDEESSDSDGEFQEPEVEETKDDTSIEILDEEDSLPFPKRREKSPLQCPRPHTLMRTNSTQELGVGLSAKEDGGGGMSTVQKFPKSKVLGRRSTLTPEEKARALQRASAFKSENPCFMVAMQPSYIHSDTGCNLNIPFKFAKKYFNEKHGKVILRVSDGRTWAVMYYLDEYNAKPKACFNHKYWMTFSEENNLKVGDVCVFQLIKDNKNSLNVVIVPADEDLNCSMSQDNGDAGISSSSKFISKYPFFKVHLDQGHLENRNLHVPITFIDQLIKKKVEQNVTLQVGDRSWPVKLISYPHNSYGKLSRGWTAFAQENSLHEGDICVFELIRRDDAVLKVSIFRCAG